MSDRKFFPFLIALTVILWGTTSFGDLVYDQCSFHDASHITSGGPEAEGGEVDNGGTIFVFIRNTGSTIEYFYNDPGSKIKLNGTQLGSVNGYKWARVWPKALNPGESATITIKGISSPVAEGQNVHFEIWSDTNTKLDFWQVLTTPKLRIGNVVPSQDNKTLFIYMRNTDQDWWYRINQVYVAGQDVTQYCTFVGGTDITVNDVKVIKVAYSDEWQLWPTLKPLPIRIFAKKGGTEDMKVGAFIRRLEPVFPLGTWSAEVFNNDSDAIEARESFGLNLAGPAFNWDNSGEYSATYCIKSTPMPDNSYPLDSTPVIEKQNYPGIFAWFVDDEPELSNRGSKQIYDSTMVVWDNDMWHSTMVNNARSKQFQQYGMAVDHPSYDHYCQYANLVYGGIGTTYSIKNSYRYMDTLKQNCEPLRSWSYLQGVSTTTGWGGQCQTWGIRVQFWNQVMAGTKGLKWFFAENQAQNGYSDRYDAMKQETKTFNQMKWLALYSDVAKRVNVSNSNMISQMLVGEDTIAVIVTNSSGWCYKGLWYYNVGMDQLWDQSISFEVPWPINIERVQQLTENGLVTPSYNINNHDITIYDLDLLNDSPYRVFIIGKNDTTPPCAPQELNIPTWEGSTAVLSWEEPYDNIGVKGYKVYKNGSQIAETRMPMYKVTNANVNDSYYVKAYDSVGNLSAASPTLNQRTPFWNFTELGDFEGWSEIHSAMKPIATWWGAMHYWTISSSQPTMISPEVRIDTSAKKHVKMRYYNGTSGTQACLYWSTDGVNWSGYQWFDINPANSWNDVDLDLTNNAGWTGEVKLFRLDMPAYGQTDWQISYFDYIQVY